MLLTIIGIFFILSIITSILVVAACMLSSRISQEENLVEDYEEPMQEEPQTLGQPYSLKS